MHGLPPLIAPNTRVLILGSFPGVKSLETQQYYGHPQNNFWKLVFSIILPDRRQEICASSYEIRSKLLIESSIGCWDVYASCEREGSLDSAIRNAQLNDLASLKKRCPKLQAIAHNGGESYSHAKHTEALGLPIYKLPSSSPANASWSFERKLAAWQEALLPHIELTSQEKNAKSAKGTQKSQKKPI
nr:DNA-deoxyinosine glycosylase [Variovorax sp. PCZ-1]